MVSDIPSQVYNTELEGLVTLANSSGALNYHCLKEQAYTNNVATCMLAPLAYRYLKAPSFILNSGIDEWQVYFLETMQQPLGFQGFEAPSAGAGFENSGQDFNQEIQSWQTCFMSFGFQACSSKQIKKLMRFHQDFERELQQKQPSAVGNGVFVHSCPLHTEAFQDHVWNTLKVNGVSEQQAVLNWWHGGDQDANSMHTHLDCHLNPGGPPYTCNPTCPIWFPSLG